MVYYAVSQRHYKKDIVFFREFNALNLQNFFTCFEFVVWVICFRPKQLKNPENQAP